MSWSRCTTWPASSSHIACSTPQSTTLCMLWKLIIVLILRRSASKVTNSIVGRRWKQKTTFRSSAAPCADGKLFDRFQPHPTSNFLSVPFYHERRQACWFCVDAYESVSHSGRPGSADVRSRAPTVRIVRLRKKYRQCIVDTFSAWNFDIQIPRYFLLSIPFSVLYGPRCVKFQCEWFLSSRNELGLSIEQSNISWFFFEHCCSV